MLADVVLEEACTGACRIGQCFQLQWVWNCDLDDVKVSDDETSGYEVLFVALCNR